jgi:Flp pilus assembly pilin Flp
MLSSLRARAKRDERGAVAIVYGLVAVLLMAMAALGTDIGNQVNRHTETQTQADFGAFAGGAQMPNNGKVGQTPPPQVVNAVVQSMNDNAPQDDNGVTTITATQLTDGNLLNGEVHYTSDGLQVVAPRHWVSFGMARIMGFQGSYVDATATVHAYSPGLRVMPAFAVTGCDYGLQTLADPSGGQATSVVPPLAFPTETTNTNLNSPLVMKDSSGNPLNTLPLNSVGDTLTITGSKFNKSSYVGFFRSDDTSNSAIVTVPIPLAPRGTGTGASDTFTVTIPAAVTSVETVWWVRIYNGTSATPTSNPPRTGAGSENWLDESKALPVVVGAAALQCISGPTAGNFGTVKFPRTDVPTADFLPADIANGLEKPLVPDVLDPVTSDGKCTATTPNAVISDLPTPGLQPGTNCVDTDTGLAAQVATQGLIQGGTFSDGTHYPGLLASAPTTPGCAPNGGSASKNINITGGPYQINNDVLTCFFTDGSTSIADIAKSNYSGGAVLDKSILASPRFFFVPVLKVQPANGGSDMYDIIDFRPAFITDEQAISSAIKGSNTGTSDNGIWIQGQDVKQLKVVFFNFDALPHDAGKSVMDYIGVGKPIIRLVK